MSRRKTARFATLLCTVLSSGLLALAGCSDDGGFNNSNSYVNPYLNNSQADGGADVGDGGDDGGALPDSGGEAVEDTGGQSGEDTGGTEVDACVPESNEEMCARLGIECGLLTDRDNCGVERTIDSCGLEDQVCTGFDTCGGAGSPGVCGCTPTTCDELGLLCGTVDDTCGGTLTCDTFCVDEIDSGSTHSCAIGSGSLRCWGDGGSGQLGTGNNTAQKNPTPVNLSSNIIEITTGTANTCVINAAEKVYCWGKNNRGQLGIGTTVDTNAPGATAALSGNAKQVVAGNNHVCALLVDGSVYCWGANDYGQIGNDNIVLGSNVSVPYAVTGLGADVTELTGGLDHTCALKSDGSIWCWGKNELGQLGNLTADVAIDIDANPDTDNSVLTAGLLSATTGAVPLERVPVQVGATLTGVQEMTSGANHTCAIDGAGQLWCWGGLSNPGSTACQIFGKTPRSCPIFPFSDGTPLLRYTLNTAGNPVVAEVFGYGALAPTPVDFGGLSVLTVDSGFDHTCVVVDEADVTKTNIRCFGRNNFGQLGDGTNNPWSQPVSIISDVDNSLVRGNGLALGQNHSCALVDDSNVKCWGSNASSQIGNSALMRDESYRPYNVRLE